MESARDSEALDDDRSAGKGMKGDVEHRHGRTNEQDGNSMKVLYVPEWLVKNITIPS